MAGDLGWQSFTAVALLSGLFAPDETVCLYVCVLYAFVPHLVNQHIDNLFSLWAASIDKHIASLAARHCAFFLSLHFLVSLCTVDNKLID